jgi:hypothetical protein
MGEETLHLARGTSLDNADMFLVNSGVQQLALISFNQIEVDFRAKLAVSRRSLIQEQQRVPYVNRVGIEDLFEEFVSVAELRLELRPHLGTNLIAALPDRWADNGAQIAWRTSELPPHFANALLDNASDGSPPARVKCAHGAVLHVGYQHGNAICGLDDEQQTACIGNHSVTRARLTCCSVDPMHDRGVNLLELHQRPKATVLSRCSESLQKQPAIAFHIVSCVELRQAQVESLSSVTRRNATLPGAEPVQEPRQLRKALRPEDFNLLARFCE